MVLADMMLRMGRMGSDGARIRTLGAELVISSAVTAGDDAIRAGRCSLAVIFTLLLLPLLITLRIFESPTPEDAAVADSVFELLMGNDVGPRRDFIIAGSSTLSRDRIDT